MRITLLCLSFFLLINCSKEKKENLFFNGNLYNEIINYQKKNPIPDKNLYKLFIYEISFSKQEDTLLAITVSPTGVRSKNSFGIYKNETIKPSYVIDSQNIGKKLVNIYKKDSIESYTLEGTPPHIDVIYPVYKYKVKKDKLIFIDSLR